jgi:archaellum biogenesis ATPase FlaH
MKVLAHSFPEEYLNRPPKDRVAYFKSLVRTHMFFQEAEDKLMKTILNSERVLFANVIGPTGAGKSALGRRIVKNVLKMRRQDMLKNPSIIPIAKAALPPPGTTRVFDLKDYHVAALRALHEQMIDKKISYKIVKDGPVERLVVTGRNSSRPALREAHIEAFKNRKTEVFVVDDAHHFTLTANSKQIAINFEYIKNMADESGVIHILLGTYALNDFTEMSGQLIRRSEDVHLSRYHANIPEELKAFLKILVTLLREVPIERVFDPVADGTWKDIYVHCIGCVGMLRDWILQTAKPLILAEKRELTIDDMLKTALDVKKCNQIAEEANKGEKKFLGDAEKEYAELMQKLGLVQEDDNQAASPDPEKTEIERIEDELLGNDEPGRGNPRPGQRKPERDPVGLNAEAA